MTKSIRATAALILIPASLVVGGCGGSKNQSSANGDVAQPSTATPAAARGSSTPEHHSKLAGAAVGAVVGHELGGHAVAGAAIGAAIQHHRNKKAR